MFTHRILSSPLPGEKVLIVMRRHWFTVLKVAVLYLLLFILPLLARTLLMQHRPEVWDALVGQEVWGMLARLAVSAYYLIVWVFFGMTWTNYYLDVWVITNERLIALEQRGLFNRSVLELKLSRVQDVTANVKGMLHTLFDYGDVRVQTAGEGPDFVFAQVTRPYQLVEKVVHLADDWRHEHQQP